MPGQMGVKRVRESVDVVQRAKDDALEALRLLSETPERKQQRYVVESPSDMLVSGSPPRDNDELQAVLEQMQSVLNAGYRHELEAVNALMHQNEVHCRQLTEAQCRDQFAQEVHGFRVQERNANLLHEQRMHESANQIAQWKKYFVNIDVISSKKRLYVSSL